MEPFRKWSGTVTLLDLPNVDTDQVIPKQFLKRIERTGFGKYLFYDWRFLENGELNPDFEMNADRYREASILVARENFGCGSSREHAPWALLDYGFRVILAPSFADIFYNNCFKNGLLPIQLPQERVEDLFERVRGHPGFKLTVDLENRSITLPDGSEIPFEIDSFRQYCLINGLDDIGLTLQHEDKIKAYEQSHQKDLQLPAR